MNFSFIFSLQNHFLIRELSDSG